MTYTLKSVNEKRDRTFPKNILVTQATGKLLHNAYD
jgi:hypothetical protein